MQLERVIEFGYPITAVSVNSHVRGNSLLEATLAGAPSRVVHANTGEPSAGRARGQWRTALAAQRVSRVGSVTAEARGSDIVILSRADRTELRRLRGHTTPVTALTTCSWATERLLVSAGEDGHIGLWNVRTGELHKLVMAGATTVLIGYVGPDYLPRIASGGPDGALRIWNPARPTPPRTGHVSTRGFSDRVATVDLLERGSLVSTMAEVLWPGGDDGPTVIAVDGAWGSGKSTVLELVRRRMTEECDNPPRGRKLTVFGADRMLRQMALRVCSPRAPSKRLVASFNPWRHQSSEQVHSPLLTFAGLGFGLSLLAQLTKLNVPWAWTATAALTAFGVVHTGKRYF